MAIFLGMGQHSVVEAKNQLSDLIDRALKGEPVVIIRHGRPVAEIRPIPQANEPISPKAIDWLVERRVGRRKPRQSTAALVRSMRDEWGE